MIHPAAALGMILAADPTAPAEPTGGTGSAQTGADMLLGGDTTLGKIVVTVGGFIAIGIVLLALVNSLGHFGAGRIGKGIKTLLSGIIGAAIFFNLSLTLQAVKAAGNLMGALLTAIGQLINVGG